jgi:hypothetical protein
VLENKVGSVLVKFASDQKAFRITPSFINKLRYELLKCPRIVVYSKENRIFYIIFLRMYTLS